MGEGKGVRRRKGESGRWKARGMERKESEGGREGQESDRRQTYQAKIFIKEKHIESPEQMSNIQTLLEDG